MSEERDPSLVELFARAEALPDGAAFVASVEARLSRARRRRAVVRTAGAAGVALVAWWLSPHAIAASVAFGDGVAGFMPSPAGWGASVLVGLWVLRRVRLRMARG